MHVFVTGASGFVGSAVVKELLAHGHVVSGLARSEAAAAAVAAAGAQVRRGALQDLDALHDGARGADGVIHCAFNHDFSRFAENSADERRAIDALSAALEGSGKPLVVTSGVALLKSGRLATEADSRPADLPFPRDPETPVTAAVARGVRACLVRLSPSVHGEGDHGFVPQLVATARAKGVSAYIGEGLNHWPGVHRLDAAALFRLALEKGAAGARYHAVADEGVPLRDIAAAIGRGLGVPVVSKRPDEAEAHFGGFAMFAGIDALASSARTQAELGWRPTRPGLMQDLEAGVYTR